MPWVVALTCCPLAGTQPARSGTRPSPSSITGEHRYGGSLSWSTGEGKLRHSFGVSVAAPHPLQGIFLVYDISSERSYQHIVKWASDVDEVGAHRKQSGGSPAPCVCVGGRSLHCSPTQYAPDGVQKILIGNKADEEHKRQVPKEQGLQVSGGCCVPPPRGQDPSCTPSMASLSLSPICTRDPDSPPAALLLSGTPKHFQPLPAQPGTPPPSCSLYPGTPKAALFLSTPAVVVHPQGSLFPTCKMFRTP